jgi:hypothetical protein
MSILTKTFYDALIGDAELVALISQYEGLPAVFTTDPAPDSAAPPYVVTAGEVSQEPSDTKTTLGRTIMRDVRCYAPDGGSAETIEAIAERVRAIFHRQELSIDGYTWILSDVTGPIVADERDAYGRILTVEVVAREN